MKVDKTPLPGIGMRKDIVTSSGRRIGTVTQRDGETALIISRQDDPDACLVSVPLTADEAATLGNLLGAHQLVAQLTEEHRDLPGVNTRQFLIARGSPFEGYRLGDTRMRTRTGASVVAALRDGKVEPSPNPDFTLQTGDLLVAVGTSDGLEAAAEILGGG
ncbi:MULTISPECIES: cation:proton antiporter regulatory subunit [unclassified Arthrobacter]|uniref:cation:proton antiporter regulatory subunit n=1 Tax=unclassified Arthrobacter TaxID=235627 RepID=UPI001492617A|nr:MULTISPECIES: cation:proton antiporter regulatory subunit [unclassified Arthrobacter]MBE0009362.1 potassium transporter TrkA [Arthrobacter sp. AET 35A]NOJ63197.1 cation:proton antiporter regulatory subunit [Arthrobacter sp. 147(2020)]